MNIVRGCILCGYIVFGYVYEYRVCILFAYTKFLIFCICYVYYVKLCLCHIYLIKLTHFPVVL